MKLEDKLTTFYVTLLVIACVAGALTGCGGQSPTQVTQDVTHSSPFTRYGVDGYYIREFRLTDGTRCVSLSGAGITCEWRQSCARPSVEARAQTLHFGWVQE